MGSPINHRCLTWKRRVLLWWSMGGRNVLDDTGGNNLFVTTKSDFCLTIINKYVVQYFCS